MAMEFQVTGDIQLLRVWKFVCHPFLYNSVSQTVLEDKNDIFAKSTTQNLKTT